MSYNTPQPTPQNRGGPVWPLVLEYFKDLWGIGVVGKALIKDGQERNLQGKAKYGVELSINNSRDPVVDAYQEALDCCVYLRQAVETIDFRYRFTTRVAFEAACENAYRLRTLLYNRDGK